MEALKNMKELKTEKYKTFEDIKHIDENGVEYWEARELFTMEKI